MFLCLLGHRNTTCLCGLNEKYSMFSHPMFLRVLSPWRAEQASCGRRLSGCWPFKRSIFTGAHSCMERGAQRRQWHTERLYLRFLTSVTPHNTSCRTVTLWLSGRERVLKLVQPIRGACILSNTKIIKKKTGSYEVCARQGKISPFKVDLSEV